MHKSFCTVTRKRWESQSHPKARSAAVRRKRRGYCPAVTGWTGMEKLTEIEDISRGREWLVMEVEPVEH
jgi:hypothetical protein